jgi:hypothetical protein
MTLPSITVNAKVWRIKSPLKAFLSIALLGHVLAAAVTKAWLAKKERNLPAHPRPRTPRSFVTGLFAQNEHLFSPFSRLSA